MVDLGQTPGGCVFLRIAWEPEALASVSQTIMREMILIARFIVRQTYFVLYDDCINNSFWLRNIYRT